MYLIMMTKGNFTEGLFADVQYIVFLVGLSVYVHKLNVLFNNIYDYHNRRASTC